ncbi:MAG: NUDIX domain-containing protein [Patescibacteria group bacterium]
MKKGEDYIGVTVSYLCHDGKGNFLFNKRSVNCRDEHEKWDAGGGGMEIGETVEETLRKEIAEEYCTDVLEFTPVGYRDIHREHHNKKTHWISLDFIVLIDREKVKNGEPHKFDEIGWFTLDNLPSPLHSQFPEFLKRYKDRI